MLRPALALLALALPALGQELVPDTRVVLELSAGDSLEGRGPARTFEYPVTFTGKLYVWAASSDFDPLLSITDEEGQRLGQDDDSGGGTTAFLSLAVVPHTRLRITPGATEPGASGTLVLHASEAPETEATLAAAEDAREAQKKAEEAKQAGDLALARETLARAVQELVAVEQGALSPALTEAAVALGFAANGLSDLKSAAEAWGRALEYVSRTLPEDHPYLLGTQLNVAVTSAQLGEFAAARTLLEQVLSVQMRTLPDDHPELQRTRMCLAGTLRALGDLAEARALQEQVVAVLSRTFPEDHPDLQRARGNLASMIRELGDLAAARALEEQVLAVLSRTLPDDDSDLQLARMNLAITIKELGDLAGARALQEQVLAMQTRALPDDHPDLQRTRDNLSLTIRELGDLTAARALQEQVLAVFSRTLPDDHPDLQRARINLAGTLRELGDLATARALGELVLAALSRTFPEGHPDLQRARGELAATIKGLGDIAGARVLEELVLADFSRTLPDDHPDLQTARENLSVTLYEQGDLAEARVLEEQVLAVRTRTLPDNHPDLQVTRGNLAATTRELGDHDAARALFEQQLASLSCTLPDDHPNLQRARANLAVTIAHQIAGREAGEVTEAGELGRKELDRLIRAFARGLCRSVATAIADSSSREAEERVFASQDDLGRALSLAAGMGVIANDPGWEREAFIASETARSAALASARIAREAHADAGYGEMCSRLREASAELAGLAQAGAGVAELDRARAEVDRADRDLVRRAAGLSGGVTHLLEPDFEALASTVKADEALVAYRSYERETIEAGKPARDSVQSLCAYVVRSDERLERVELGSIDAIEGAVERWREALGTSAGRGIAALAAAKGDEAVAGAELRGLVLDPLRETLAGVERVIVVLDDALHAVPLDALPSDERWREGGHVPAGDLMGACLRIEVRSSLLELLVEEPPLDGSPRLLALGGPDFGPLDGNDPDLQPAPRAARAAEASGVLRGSVWEKGFAELSGTREEVLGIAQHFEECFGEQAERQVLLRERATRESLFELAPQTRFLHVATHGWFAPASIRSLEDPRPIDWLSGFGHRTGSPEHLHGMNPMLLCGLALAGANSPAGPTGRIPGVVTAQELAALDLMSCELAVLSACDTNVGVCRAGQGVASLQMALRMAGARSVITSLWKVPDDATRELMVDFYRRIWLEKEPKWQALWEAKMALREAKDEHDLPLYSTRDWAGWVLTGEPD